MSESSLSSSLITSMPFFSTSEAVIDGSSRLLGFHGLMDRRSGFVALLYLVVVYRYDTKDQIELRFFSANAVGYRYVNAE